MRDCRTERARVQRQSSGEWRGRVWSCARLPHRQCRRDASLGPAATALSRARVITLARSGAARRPGSGARGGHVAISLHPALQIRLRRDTAPAAILDADRTRAAFAAAHRSIGDGDLHGDRIFKRGEFQRAVSPADGRITLWFSPAPPGRWCAVGGVAARDGARLFDADGPDSVEVRNFREAARARFR